MNNYMDYNKISSLVSLAASVIITTASFFQWQDVQYNGIKTRKWFYVVNIGVMVLIVASLIFIIIA